MSSDLYARQAYMQRMSDFYSGEHPLPFLTKAHNAKMRDEFRQLLDDSRSNFMRLVVDAAEERLRVEGFRLSASSDSTSDKATWDIWQANAMDQESKAAFLEALIKGVSYLSVWAGEEHPSIAVEDPVQTIVAYEAGSNYRRRAAALKVWDDEWTGERRANVYLPDGIHKFAAAAEAGVTLSSPTAWPHETNAPNPARGKDSGPRWVEVEDGFEPNPLGVVPIIPLRNRPRILTEGESELADVYRVQSSINGFLFLLALSGYFGAHRQRWAVGLRIMEDDKGRPVEPFDVAVDRLWQAEDPEVKFGEFGQTDLTGYIRAIEQKVLHIAVTTRTPRHYLIQEGQSPSGDAIKSAESGLVAKVERKHGPFGEGLEEALRLARRFAGEEDAPVDSEIVWASPETESEAVLADATVKKFQAGLIPWEQALEDLGYSQTQIARMRAQRAQDDLLRALEPPAPEAEAPEPEPEA
jgi:hypothetical protein